MFIRDGDAAAREIPHQMWYVASAALSPDGRSDVATGSDLKQRGGAHLIDTATGATPPFQSGFTEGSRDGRRIRYTEVQGDEMVLFERDAQDEHSQEIFRTRERDIRWLRVSPDGRFVGYVQRQQNADGRIAHEFKVAPLSGGAPRAIAEIPGFTQFWQWAGDSQSVFILNPVGEGAELWRLPLAGDPRKLAVDARHWTAFQISPDGKRIAFSARAGKPGFEVWALENFLPVMEAAASARSARK